MSYYNQNQPPVGVPPPQGYPQEGYGKDSYPPQGYPAQGYPPQGYPPQGYPPQYAGQPPPPPRNPPVCWKDVWLLYAAVASLMPASDHEILERSSLFGHFH